MTPARPQPTLDFYRRDNCAPCDQARLALQQVLEDRAKRGLPNPRVRYRNVADSPELEAAYGARVPVIALGDDELALTLSERRIAAFLDRAMARTTHGVA